MNLIKKEVQITKIKSMADGSYRVEFDLQEVTGTQLGDLEDLRKEGLVELLVTSLGSIDNALKENKENE